MRSVRHVLDLLIQSFDRADRERGRKLLAGVTPCELYEAAMTVVLRLAILLSKERLKLSGNSVHCSLFRIGRTLRKAADEHGEEALERSHTAGGRVSDKYRTHFAGAKWAKVIPLDDLTLLHLIETLQIPTDLPETQVIERLGQIQEALLDYTVKRAEKPGAVVPTDRFLVAPHSGRRKTGTHYTPRRLTQPLVQATLDPLVYVGPREGMPRVHWRIRSTKEILSLKICDPACGSGAFLLEACRYLAERLMEGRPSLGLLRARRLVAEKCLCGVDKNPLAVEMTKLSLCLLTRAKDNAFLDHAIRCGESLAGFQWQKEFPEPFRDKGGFDAILGNPPWGQKAIADSPSLRRLIRRDYVSCAGIHDLFRPFVERGIRLLADNGVFGMVLPDILLLKDYPDTRKFLLENLAIQRIDWWGRAFAAAVIDTITLVGIRTVPSANHKVQVWLHERGADTHRRIAQADFWSNPKYAFNLHLTSTARRVVDALQKLPTLGDYFEIHEGVHSGNVRAELFVDRSLDDTCREMFFGRDEIQPYSLRWRGKYVRLGTLPETKTRARYANAGQAHWYAQPKVLVRRTGDFVLAAVDVSGRYASNNFFVVFPKNPCPLNLFGLCALLNSRFMTWFFRTIEPRQGRVFAELKIKHLKRFPLPSCILLPRGCGRLNALGARRARLAVSRTEKTLPEIDSQINDLVCHLYGNVHPSCE